MAFPRPQRRGARALPGGAKAPRIHAGVQSLNGGGYGPGAWDLQGGCKNTDYNKKCLGLFFGTPRGRDWAQNVPPGTSFRTPKHRPNPANGGPIGGQKFVLEITVFATSL